MEASQGLNLSWVSDTLAVGGSFASSLIPLLAGEQRIRHVVDMRLEARDEEPRLRAHNLDFLHLPTPDHHALSTDMLNTGVAWVAARRARTERVYLHCQYGIGRSVLLAMCVLVDEGEAPLEALRRIKNARPCASPSPAQLHAFLRWAAHVHPLPSWEALAQVAYQGIQCESSSRTLA